MRRLGILISITLAIVFGIVVLHLSTVVSFFDLSYLLKVALIFSLSVFLIYVIQRRHSFYLPSFYLFLFFSLVPVFGILGYLYFYRKLYSDYFGIQLDLNYALDLWLQGTFFVMLGIFLTYLIKRAILKFRKPKSKSNTYMSWDWQRFRVILFMLVCISVIFTIFSIMKIGYVPLLKGNIAIERFYYWEKAGEWPFKFSKLWLLVYLFTFILLLRNIKLDKGFYIHKNLPLIFLLVSSIFFAGIYGARYCQFIMIVFSVIMVNKIIGRIKLLHLIVFFLIGVLLANFVVAVRDENYRALKMNVLEKNFLRTFSEFRTFAYAVQTFSKVDFLNGKAFIGTIAPIFPKQLWAAFNINKNELSSFNSARIMADIFNTNAGMRIGIIGEGYINFGYFGIVFICLFAGILFGILENIFISLKHFDVKEIIIVFAISIIMFLPISQSDTFLNEFVLNALFIIGFIIFFHKKQDIKNYFGKKAISLKPD